MRNGPGESPRQQLTFSFRSMGARGHALARELGSDIVLEVGISTTSRLKILGRKRNGKLRKWFRFEQSKRDSDCLHMAKKSLTAEMPLTSAAYVFLFI